MFAIFETGGKQYKVSQGDILRLEKCEATEGETLTFKEVLLTADGTKIEVGQPFVSAAVEAKVLTHGKSDKIRVVKKKAKKRYFRTQGHRQQFTEIEIIAISGTKVAKPTAKKEETKAEVKTEKASIKKTVVTKTVATKKSSAKTSIK